MSILCRVDDKLVPLYRVMWVAATPHFCGEEDCQREGCYEVRLEHGESVWANDNDRSNMQEQLELWQGGLGPTDPDDSSEGQW
ncbi:MAG: hypothetical protein CMJ72_11550 [Planctomycetaceae bacterium]|jgi:hypothetical protein|nr:hypothetical protein [Planctomycetaceae bacterium]HCK41676.1 hypothetical protein [Planctomycetaceae bacterium]|tara:strand:+ start:520 stop:768 length:249 start_codon:yes stop_codon:yes gene_type:complete